MSGLSNSVSDAVTARAHYLSIIERNAPKGAYGRQRIAFCFAVTEPAVATDG